MKNIISMLNEEVKGMDKILCTFKKPKYLFQHNQIEPVKSTSGQIILASLDKTSNERDALSVAILEGYQHLTDNDINAEMQHHYEAETKRLRLSNFEKQNEFQKFDLNDLISAYEKIKFIKDRGIYNKFKGFHINNNELVTTNSVLLGCAKLKTPLNIEFTLTKNILNMLKKISDLKIITNSSISVMNHIVYINILCGKYTLKIASRLANENCYFDYKYLFKSSFNQILNCDVKVYLDAFNNIKEVINLNKTSSKDNFHTTLLKDAFYIAKTSRLQADDIKYKYDFHTDLKSKYMITFNQDYVLDILKANKKTKAFKLKLKGAYDIMEFNFNDVTYFLCPIRPADLPYEKLAEFKN